MAGGKHKNISNRNQGYLASSEPNSPTIASPGYPNTPEKQDSDLKSLLMMMIEDIKKGINNFFKEIQDGFDSALQIQKWMLTVIYRMEHGAPNEEAREGTQELKESATL